MESALDEDAGLKGLGHDVHTNGFAVIPGVLRRADTEPVLRELDRTDLARRRAGVRRALKYAWVAALARNPLVLALAQRVLGGEAYPFRATLFDKSRDSNWLVVWHQDTALPLREKREAAGWGPWSVKDGVIYAHAPASALRQVRALRIHLDDSTADNGPLRVLPGTHTRGVLSDGEIRELVAEIPPVSCLCSAGGVVAMRPLILHSSSKSVSDIARRVLHIEYAICRTIENLELAVA